MDEEPELSLEPDTLSTASLVAGAALVIAAKLAGEPWPAWLVVGALLVLFNLTRQMVGNMVEEPAVERALAVASVLLVVFEAALVPVVVWAAATGRPPLIPG
jgi:hypothetical protein